MEDLIRKTVLKAKKAAPNDWFGQRKIIGMVINEIAKSNPKSCDRQEFPPVEGKKLILYFIKFEGDDYIMWEVVIGEVLECSGLEKVIAPPVNGKIKTELLWNSDPEDNNPFIPKLPFYFE